MKRMSTLAWVVALGALVGCVPDEMECTVRTSELRRALHGEVVRLRVHATKSVTLSNAYERVSLANDRFTNKLDVVKALAASVEGNSLFSLADDNWTNDTVRIWVEESQGVLPCVKMDASLCVALGTEDAFGKLAAERKLDDAEVVRLEIDPATGEIRRAEDNPNIRNLRMVHFTAGVTARMQLLTTLFGEEEWDLCAVDQSLFAAVMPDYAAKPTITVVGDSEEPVYVIAEHAVINGKPTENFAGYVRKGETLRITIDHRDPALNGSVRVLLKEPDATSDTTGECSVLHNI